MTGHVRRRGERSWELKYDIGSDSNGRRKTRYASFKGSKRDAAIELARLIATAAAGEQVDPSRITVAEFLKRWDTDWCKSNVSPKTRERYEELMRLHVAPHVGAVRLQKLRPVQLAELYGTLAAKLAPRTIGHVHRVLHQALSQAVEWDLLTTNVADRVQPPRVEDEEVEILTVGQLKAAMAAVREGWINPIAKLALATGLRRGELLALRWKDLDTDKARITVARSLEQTKAGLRFKEPKTKRGRRTISLPATAVNDMRAHWRDQQEIRLRLGAGKSPPDSLVFCDLNGDPRLPQTVSQTWAKLTHKAGVEATFHSLRHTHASHLIAAGVDILTISRRLGHSSPTVTLHIYGHLMPQTDDRAATAIEAALSASSTEEEQIGPITGGNPVAMAPAGLKDI
ncbi:site-specific integrase [Bradyrhizobium sp. AUGA SZCCT0160]|uniref:tyrosine-type recombinase/integrase n=1 Tax=Bradyrhizobium sp. AUGA SZCCT0160 TaxID=2807662 RepID=UPI001BAB8399|nr:site-specific integrase [Bradyrhizobium sp. AUGA SZCCT0160]MBR1190082.1 site-specific integrase [Bradyrhizobium sp. AUGA SZCCT0160]